MKKDEFSKERKVLLSLLSVKSDEEKENEIRESFLSDFDWEKLVKDSVYQAVCFFAFKRAEKYKDLIPEPIYKKWAAAAFNNMSSNINVAQAQYKITELLEENKVDYLILKGLSSASYYDEPSLRSFGDVDFLVNPKKQQEIRELILKNGYKKGLDEVEHHVIFNDSNVVFEMHLEISGIPKGEIGDKIRAFTNDALNKKIFTKINSDFIDCGFYAPDKVSHGAILLVHMQHHMTYEGLGLRHLLDWAYFVKKTENESFWEDELLPFFKEIGLYVYAKAVTKTCAIYFNSPCPKWCKDVPETLCAEIMADILRLGNFGYNDTAKSQSGIMVSDEGKGGFETSRTKYLIKAFHNLVKARHPIAVKCKILYPVFYVWEFVRYLFGVIFGKRTRVSKMMKDSKERKSVYSKLKVFETDK